MSISFDVEPPLSRVERWLARFGPQAGKAAERALDKTGAWVLRHALRAFDEQRQDGGRQWLPNKSPKYRWYKLEVRKIRKPRTGVLSGRLRKSLQMDKPDRWERRIGSPLPYARDFHEGHNKRKTFEVGGHKFTIKGQPARRFLPIDDYAQQELNDNMTREVVGVIRRHKLK